jgi:hypothetical protein
MIQLYVFLLFFEGVFRKWFPFTTIDIFYIIRDLIIGIAIILRLFQRRVANYKDLRVINFYFGIILFFAAIQVFVIENPIPVFVLGIRNYLAPLLLLYYLVLTNSLWKFHEILTKWTPTLIVMETLLCILQALSPRSSFLNLTTTGSDAIVTSGLQVRPLGTFTSSLGFSFFLCFIYSFSLTIFKSWGTRKSLTLFSCIFLDILLSGTRTVPFNILLITFVYFVFFEKGRAKLRFLSASTLSLIFIYSIIANTALKKVLEAFQVRLKYQTEGSSGTVTRIFDPVFGIDISNLTFLGTGIGKHHASSFPYLGSDFWIEVESFRWISELGLFGLILYISRFTFAIKIILTKTISGQFQRSELMLTALLPFLLFGGITTQPTVQGFSSLFICSVLAYKIDSTNRVRHYG